MNMGTGAARGAGGGGRGGAAAAGGGRGGAPGRGGLAPGLDPAVAAAGRGAATPPAAAPPQPSRLLVYALDGTATLPAPPATTAAAPAAGRGGPGGGAGRGPGRGPGGGGRGTPPPSPPSIGPEGRGNILVAWDPIAGKERWRGLSAGFNQGGTLSTAGNLVFASVNTRLIIYRADNGDQLMDITTGLSQMGPPMTFMLDGKQYVAIAGGPAQAGGGRGGAGGGGRGAAPAGR